MNNRRRPDWITETKNKSWEPEILISGITLTFLFLLSNSIYNFYAMLIQDLGVFYMIAHSLYVMTIIILTALKIVLITHLILRGIWTGLVGLGYVFPRGVKKRNLPKSDRHIKFVTPEEAVLKIERICSLLFSFIFSAISYVAGFFLFFIPIILLFVIGLNPSMIRLIIIFGGAALVIIPALYAAVFRNRLKHLKLLKKIEKSLFTLVIAIYTTNIGRAKTPLIFIAYLLLVIPFSFIDMSTFDFNNDIGKNCPSHSGPVYVNKDNYDNLRNHRLRIPRAVIERFRVTEKRLELFVSSYRDDMYALNFLSNDSALVKQFNLTSDNSDFFLNDLYSISIDDSAIQDLSWYETENTGTRQKGLFTVISLDTLKNGYHELRIDKLHWNHKKNEINRIENWGLIPFEFHYMESAFDVSPQRF